MMSRICFKIPSVGGCVGGQRWYEIGCELVILKPGDGYTMLHYSLYHCV